MTTLECIFALRGPRGGSSTLTVGGGGGASWPLASGTETGAMVAVDEAGAVWTNAAARSVAGMRRGRANAGRGLE